MHLMALTELSQLCNPLRVVGKARSCPITANTGIQRLRRNIHSTNHLLGSTIGVWLLGHGNLPCAFDWKSGDCSVVSDQWWRSQTLGYGCKPEGPRAPPTMREIRLPSGLAQRHFHIKCRLYLDTRDLQFSPSARNAIEVRPPFVIPTGCDL